MDKFQRENGAILSTQVQSIAAKMIGQCFKVQKDNAESVRRATRDRLEANRLGATQTSSK